VTTRYWLGIAELLPSNWPIRFPAFPGTVTTGRNFAELMKNARDALALVVAAIEEDRLRLPDRSDVSLESSACDPAAVSV
jgi:predicted RNase H-like HicB family nuclease